MSKSSNPNAEFVDMTEVKVSSESIFDGRIISVSRDKVRLPDGRCSTREVVRHRGAACILPIRDDGKMVFVRQFRYSLGTHTLEAPAGKLDGGEDPAVCAIRELKEETGYTAKSLIPLGKMYTSPGFCDEVIYLYAATGLTSGESCPDDGEFVSATALDADEAVDMIMSGKISDGKTQIAVLKFLQLQKSGALDK